MNQNQLQQAATAAPSIFNRAQQMASGKTTSELEQIARNICATKGINYDDALNQYKQIMGPGR